MARANNFDYNSVPVIAYRAAPMPSGSMVVAGAGWYVGMAFVAGTSSSPYVSVFAGDPSLHVLVDAVQANPSQAASTAIPFPWRRFENGLYVVYNSVADLTLWYIPDYSQPGTSIEVSVVE